jgi:hypothetical protein
MVLLLPSDPVTVTVVAFVAATVNVEEAPAAIEVGLAVMVTVGVSEPGPTEPHPATSKSADKVTTNSERIE